MKKNLRGTTLNERSHDVFSLTLNVSAPLRSSSERKKKTWRKSLASDGACMPEGSFGEPSSLKT